MVALASTCARLLPQRRASSDGRRTRDAARTPVDAMRWARWGAMRPNDACSEGDGALRKRRAGDRALVWLCLAWQGLPRCLVRVSVRARMYRGRAAL